MNKRPFWKQPQGMVLIAGGAVVLLATFWVFATSLGPSPPIVEGEVPASRFDENALIAANAERNDHTTGPDTVITANAAKPPAEEVATASSTEPPRFNPDEIAREAEAALDAAREARDAAQEAAEEAVREVTEGV